MESTQTLDAWIAAATSGLPVSAAGKFAGEIRDHAAEARQRLIDTGMPDAEADRAALDGLGDADALARTFRDAHFSRRRYARGEIAMLLVFGSFIAAMAISILSWQPSAGGEPHLASPWLALPYLAVNLLSAGCLLVGARAALTLLAEQYEVHITPGWRRVVIGVVVLACTPMLLYRLLELGASPLAALADAAGLRDAISGAFHHQTWNVMSGIAINLGTLGRLAGSAGVAAFCGWRLASRLASGRPYLIALLALAGLAAASLMVRNIPFIPPAGPLSTPWPPLADRVRSPVADVAIAANLFGFGALQLALIAVFAHMRRPGAALAG